MKPFIITLGVGAILVVLGVATLEELFAGIGVLATAGLVLL